MIQAPNSQYMQPMQMMQSYQPQGAVNTMMPAQQMPQQPGVFYNYPMTSCYAQPQYGQMSKTEYSGVNIEIINHINIL